MQVEKINESFMRVYFDDNAERSIVEDYFTLHEPNYYNNIAYKKRYWDGRTPIFAKNDLYPIGLTFELRKVAEMNSLSLTIINRDKFKLVSQKFTPREYIDLLDLPFFPHEWQFDSVESSFFNNKCFMKIATNAGKTFITYLMLRYLIEVCGCKKILFMVPRTNLLKQAKSDFEEYTDDRDFLKMLTYAGAGKKPDLGKPIVVSMWQTLQNYEDEFFDDVDAIIVDEVHTATAPKLKGIIQKCHNAVYKFGYSGTMPSNKFQHMTLTGLFGRFVPIIDAKELIERGAGTDVEIHRHIFEYDKEFEEELKLIAEAVPIDQHNRELEIYAKRMEVVYSNPKRVDYLTDMILDQDKNTLVLFTNLEYAKSLRSTLEKKIKKGGLDKQVLYLDGEVNIKYPHLFKQYMDILSNFDNVTMIATYKTFSTGVNNKNIHNCFLAQSTKSEYDILQTIGRLMRMNENKDIGLIIDIVDSILNLKNHAKTRLGYYQNEGYHVEDYTHTL